MSSDTPTTITTPPLSLFIYLYYLSVAFQSPSPLPPVLSVRVCASVCVRVCECLCAGGNVELSCNWRVYHSSLYYVEESRTNRVLTGIQASIVDRWYWWDISVRACYGLLVSVVVSNPTCNTGNSYLVCAPRTCYRELSGVSLHAYDHQFACVCFRVGLSLRLAYHAFLDTNDIGASRYREIEIHVRQSLRTTATDLLINQNFSLNSVGLGQL